MPQTEYNRMLQERAGFASKWEAIPNSRLTLEDIDLEEVRRTARKAVHVGRIDSSVDVEDAVALLERFKLRENGVLLNGAAALFGKDYLADYPHLEIKLGWFAGRDGGDFLDNRHVSGGIFKLMDEAMAFCFKHLNLSAHITGRIERDEELEIPAAALRETLINALAHRSYDDGCRTVYLAIYEDRVEIKNPGGFPSSLDIAHLYNPPVRESMPRNPRIARVLYLCKMIETWGRGLSVVADECSRTGLPLPIVKMQGGSVVTVFSRPNLLASGSHLDRGGPDMARIDPDQLQTGLGQRGDLSASLLKTIRQNPLTSRKLLSVELGVSERRVRQALKSLREKGIVVRQGADHGGIWRISKIIAAEPAGSVAPPAEGTHGNDAEVAREEGKQTWERTSEMVQTPQEMIPTEGKKIPAEDEMARRRQKVIQTIGRALPTLRKDARRNAELVLLEIAGNPRVTIAEMSTRTGKPRPTIKNALGLLRDIGILSRLGGGFGGHWVIKWHET